MNAVPEPQPDSGPGVAEPTSVVTGQLQAPDGSLMPCVQFGTPYGPLSFVLNPSIAAALGQDLIAMAKAGQANLLIPSGEH